MRSFCVIDVCLQRFAVLDAFLYTSTFSSNSSHNGVAEKGCLLIDSTTGKIYINQGTIDSVTWAGANTVGQVIIPIDEQPV